MFAAFKEQALVSLHEQVEERNFSNDCVQSWYLFAEEFCLCISGNVYLSTLIFSILRVCLPILYWKYIYEAHYFVFLASRKIPPATSNTASTRTPHRTSSVPALQYGAGMASFHLPNSAVSSPVLVSPSSLSLSGKSVPSHGTTLNANPASLGAAEHACSMQSRQVSSSPSTPPVLSSVSSPLSSKPQKLKSSKSFKPKESSASSANCNSTSSSSSGGSSGKKRKNSSVLPAPSHSTESFRKNCVVNSGNSGAAYHSPVMSSSHSVGLNCMTSKANSVSFKHDQSGRGPPTGSSAESIKRMSVMVNSGDSTLSLGPFIHQSSELSVNAHGGFSHSHPSLDKFIGKKRKCSPGSSSINSSISKANKVAKLPPVNNIHTKHAGAIAGTPGLMNSSILHQVWSLAWTVSKRCATLSNSHTHTRHNLLLFASHSQCAWCGREDIKYDRSLPQGFCHLSLREFVC